MNFPVPRVLVCAMQGFSERDMKFGTLEEVGNSSFYAIYIHVEGAVPNVIIVTLIEKTVGVVMVHCELHKYDLSNK